MKTNPFRTYQFLQQALERVRSSRAPELSEDEKRNVARFERKVERAQEFVKRHDLNGEKAVRDAALKFCLSNPKVNTVCLTVLNHEQALDYLRLSGSRLEPREASLLAAYKADCGGLYCRHACGQCEPACPHHVPVNTIMRYDHYFASQGRERHAMASYAELPSRADVCESCPGPCESACPYGLPVRALLCSAHQALSLGPSRP